MMRRTGLRDMARMLGQLAPRRWWWGGALMAALTVLMGMALLGLSGWFIAATAIAGLVPATALVFDVFMPSAGIRLLAMGRTASRYGERLVTHEATLAVLAALREKLFVGWAQPGAARLLQLRPARLLQRLTADVDALDNVYLRLIVPVVAAAGAALLVGVVLGALQWWLGLAAFGWLLMAGMGLTIWLARCSTRPAVQRALALERLRAQTVDAVAGQTDLLMTGQLPAQCARIAQTDARVAQADHALNRLDAQAAAGFGIAGALTLAGVLAGAGYLVHAGVIGAPGAALALLVALTAMEPFSALRRGALEAGRTRLAARRLGARMANAPVDAALPVPQGDVAFVLDHAGVQHADSPVAALQSVSLCIQKTERVALVGASGAGKSTLMAVLAGEQALTHGHAAAVPSVWLTQRVALFQDSMRDNLRLAVPLADDAALWGALEDAGLAADVRAMPQGLDSVLGEGGLGLSGGQARRLGLARLLLAQQPAWLLDEPTEGLDAATARDVLQRLQARAQHHTVVLCTHLQREAALADRLIWVNSGVVQAQARRGEPSFEALIARLRPD
ncbi:ATP-binding cassette domain-containing protein [Comamonas sp.]|uniref:amino acid ABC transporter ATP-binding/permease protein n=1 Tax=Comamonas sp. TaxID=34028 RepID=UPI002896A059|nr:ATP-binding cassette domain-containing protein [Comamonas sp.]